MGDLNGPEIAPIICYNKYSMCECPRGELKRVMLY